MEEKDNIGELFEKTFEDFKAEDIQDEWIDLDIKLSRSSFKRFSVSEFNIYYASLIIISFLLTTAVAVDRFIINISKYSDAATTTISKTDLLPFSKNPTIIVDSIFVSKDSSHTKSGFEIIDRQTKPNKIPENKSPLITANDSADNTNIKKTYIPIPTSDSLFIKNSSVLQTIDSVKKRKKTVFIIRQDTIIKYDTLKVKKKRK
jgi:hypothetical protein